MDGAVGWGILGCANIAEKVCVAITEATNASVVAVGSRSIEKAEKFVKDNAPGAKAYDSYDAVLDDSNVKVVYIPLPTTMKKEWVLKAAEKGKHVLCEKPISVNAGDAKAMVEACSKAGVQFMDNTMLMHHVRLSALKSTLQDAEFGSVKHVVSCFTIPFGNDDGWASSNIRMSATTEPFGSLGDLGWYNIRISQWAFQYEEPQEVSCHYFEETTDRVPITAHAIMKYSGGRTATFDCSFKCALRQWVEVVGKKRKAYWDDAVVDQLESKSSYTVESADIANKALTFPKTIHEGASKTFEGHTQQHTQLVQCMSQIAMEMNPDSHWPSISEQTQRILLALHASAQNGGSWTKVEPSTFELKVEPGKAVA